MRVIDAAGKEVGKVEFVNPSLSGSGVKDSSRWTGRVWLPATFASGRRGVEVVAGGRP
jgi:hypothetical protein